MRILSLFAFIFSVYLVTFQLENRVINASILWIGVVFGILSLSTFIYTVFFLHKEKNMPQKEFKMWKDEKPKSIKDFKSSININIDKLAIYLFVIIFLFILFLWSGGIYKYSASKGNPYRINKVTGELQAYYSGGWKQPPR